MRIDSETIKNRQAANALGVTVSQLKVLSFIRKFIDIHGYPPSRKDIADGLSYYSHNAAQEHLEALARRGKIELIKGVARGIRVIV